MINVNLAIFLAYADYKNRMAKIQRVKEGEAPRVESFELWSATSFTATQLRIRARAASAPKKPSNRTTMGRRSEWS
ncbi:hypothetical protein [Burkholderia phage vB_BglM_WTB]